MEGYNTGVKTEWMSKIDALKIIFEEYINNSILQANSLFTFSKIGSISLVDNRVKIDGLNIEFDDFMKNIAILDVYLSEKEQSI